MWLRAVLAYLLVLQATNGLNESCWQDLLVAGQDLTIAKGFTKLCMPEPFFIAAAIHECGQNSSAQQLVGQCESPDGKTGYAEMEYTCCKPKNQSTDNEKFVGNALKMKSMAENIIKEYVIVTKRLSEALAKNDSETVRFIQLNELTELRRRLTYATFTIMIATPPPPEISFKHTWYMSQMTTLNLLKHYLSSVASTRMSVLTPFIAERVFGRFMPNSEPAVPLRTFDIEFVNNETVLKSAYDVFPELKPKLENFYVDVLKNTTIGFDPNELEFLAEPGAHQKLADMYTHILMEAKFAPEPSYFTVITILALSITLLAGVAFGISTAYGLQLKKRGIKASQQVVYEIFDDGQNP